MTMYPNLFTSVHDLPSDEWDQFAAKKSHHLKTNHLKAVEQSVIDNFQPFYLTFSRDNRIIGIVYFTINTIDFTSFQKQSSQNALRAIKSWYPDFLKKRVVECGHVAGLGTTFISNHHLFADFIQGLCKEFDGIAEENGCEIILIRDIEFDNFEVYEKEFSKNGYLPVMGYPRAVLNIHWESFEGYLSSLKSIRRKQFKKSLNKLNADGITFRKVIDFGGIAEDLVRLWRNVHDKATAYKHETLNKTYFQQININMGEDSFILLVEKEDIPVAFLLCLNEKDVLSALHVGVDYAYNEFYDLYFNIHLLTIKEAIDTGKCQVDFGITTYEYKMRMGCELLPMIYFIKYVHNRSITSAMTGMLHESIEQPPNSHRAFKDQDINQRFDLKKIEQALLKYQCNTDTDIFKKAYNFTRSRRVEFAGIYTYFPVFECPQRAVMQNFGQRVIMLGSNSYLGLGSHEDMKETAKNAVDIYGTGCTGSPIMNGTLDVHADLCRSLARWMGKEDVILFSTGYQTNLGVISSLVGRHEIIVTDSLNHASIIDGSLFSRGEIKKYRHDDFEDLERVLKENSHRPVLLIVDSVFSMEGTIINMPQIVRLGKKYGARIMVDEAHGMGVLGETGRGAVEHFGLVDDVDIIMGTFSKSFASIGGFVASQGEVIHYLKHTARPHLFSASLPPSVIATIRKALEIIKNEPERRIRLLENAKFMADNLEQLGYEARFRGTAVVPVYCRDELLTLAFFRKLYQEGVYVNPVLSPAVPKGSELLRTSYMSTHDESDLLQALEVFKKLRTEYFPRRMNV